MKFPKVNLLIIESNRFLVRILLETLADEFNVIVASNGNEAMNLLEKGLSTDFIVTDLKVPKVDGLELIQLVRKSSRYHSLPILALSGSEDSNTRIRCLENGADDCMTKPFNPLELQAKIRAMLRRVSIPFSRPVVGAAPYYAQAVPVRA
ncbi:response regulator transcription factor [Larkinella humicola]|uniref:Response regulator n=1 Tax=Larkinella humicola TaxID=2607654 RepID=A0A5N1JSP1_9BACT|nr:response regulator transcription factor [Larkinella humicola]KAA9357639.1 response regulator [Larkinella humicola]